MEALEEEKQLPEILKRLQIADAGDLTFDTAAIEAEYQNQKGESTSLVIKVVSVLGGFMASSSFIGFLALGGLFDSGIALLVFGIGFIAAALWINQLKNLLVDTAIISGFVIGFVLTGIGINILHGGDNTICITLISLAICALCITRNYLLCFISLLIINGSLLVLIGIHNSYNLVHLYITGNAIAYTLMILYEARLITAYPSLSKLYNPIRIGLVFSLVAGLVIAGIKDVFPVSYYSNGISSVVLMILVVWMESKVTALVKVSGSTYKIIIYAATILVMLPTLFSPAVSGSLLIILLSFYVNHKTGFGLGIMSLMYALWQYYYDLHFSLLTKSLILMGSGILFLIVYFICNRYLQSNEDL